MPTHKNQHWVGGGRGENITTVTTNVTKIEVINQWPKHAVWQPQQFVLTLNWIFFLWHQLLNDTNPTLNPLSPSSDQHYFLLTISIQCQEIRLWELIKWSPKRNCFDLLSNSLNLFFKEMYKDQFGEFACGYWGLKGKGRNTYVGSSWGFLSCSFLPMLNPQKQMANIGATPTTGAAIPLYNPRIP